MQISGAHIERVALFRSQLRLWGVWVVFGLLMGFVASASVAADKAGEQWAFRKLVVPRKEAFVGEVLAVELQVYIRDNVANAENILQFFDGFGGAPLKAEGFSVLKTVHGQRRAARVGSGLF